MKITCQKCKTSFHRSAAIIVESGPHYKALCPACNNYVKFIPYMDRYKEQLDNGLILEHLYFGSESKNVTVYTTDKNIDITAKIEFSPVGVQIRKYFEMSERLSPVSLSTAKRIAEIISENIHNEFGINAEEIRENVKSLLLEDKSKALPFLRRARQLATETMECAIPAAA